MSTHSLKLIFLALLCWSTSLNYLLLFSQSPSSYVDKVDRVRFITTENCPGLSTTIQALWLIYLLFIGQLKYIKNQYLELQISLGCRVISPHYALYVTFGCC